MKKYPAEGNEAAQEFPNVDHSGASPSRSGPTPRPRPGPNPPAARGSKVEPTSHFPPKVWRSRKGESDPFPRNGRREGGPPGSQGSERGSPRVLDPGGSDNPPESFTQPLGSVGEVVESE